MSVRVRVSASVTLKFVVLRFAFVLFFVLTQNEEGTYQFDPTLNQRYEVCLRIPWSRRV